MKDKEQEYDWWDNDASRKAVKRMKREEREKKLLKATPLLVGILWGLIALLHFMVAKEIEGLICVVISALWTIMYILMCKE